MEFDESKHPRAEDGKFSSVPSKGDSVKDMKTADLKKNQTIDISERKYTTKEKPWDITEEEAKKAKAFVDGRGWDSEMKNAMAGRLLADLSGYFSHNGRLWGGDFREHIAILKECSPERVSYV